VTTPHSFVRGFSQEPNGMYPLAAVSRRLRPSLRSVQSRQAACGHCPTSSIGTPNAFVRECFYPGERFTLEPVNTLQLFVYERQYSIDVNKQIFIIQEEKVKILSYRKRNQCFAPALAAPQLKQGALWLDEVAMILSSLKKPRSIVNYSA
jgi:hypothetical protein